MAVRFHENVKTFLVPIEQVHQHPDNPNNGDIDAIVASIELNGFYSVVLAQKSTGYLVAGNHRYAALLALRAKEIPVIWLDIDDDAAYTILVGDNQIAALAEQDQYAVLDILNRLTNNGVNIAAAGFTQNAHRELVAKVRARSHTPLPEDISIDRQLNRGAQVVVYGYYNEDGTVTRFTFGDLPDVVMNFRDHGYAARGGESG